MRILLINPPIRLWSQPNCFPQGLGYIAQVLRKDHDVRIWDMNADRRNWHKIFKTEAQCFTWQETEEISEYLKEVDAVGITGLITNYVMVKGLISFIKGFDPEIPVVVGGPLGTSIPEIMLRKAGADICVIGEGEETAVELFKELCLGKGVCYISSGVAWRNLDGDVIWNKRKSSIKNISLLPLPAYDLFPTEIYAKNPVGSSINKAKWIDGRTERPIGLEWELSTIKEEQIVPKSMNILSSRGCAWRCLFCYHDYMGAKYRYRNAQSLFDEIAYLLGHYGVQFFLMGDDCFITNRKNVVDFCELMISSGLSQTTKWECGGRVDTVDRELLELMRKAGCLLVGYGIESGSQKMLDRMNKRVTVDQCHRAVEMTQDVFGDCECTFIVGTPGETRETIQETVDFCKRHNLPPHAIFFMTPYPGTPLWEWMRKEGWFGSSERWLEEEERLCLKLSDNEQGETIIANFTEFSDEELYLIKQELVEELNAWNKITH